MSIADKENESPNRFDAATTFLAELADANTPEDLLRSLAIATKKTIKKNGKDQDVQDGVVHALLRTLRSSLVLQNRRGSKCFLETLTQERAMQISIVITALEMVLQCSAVVLVAHLEALISGDLLPSLVQVANVYLPHDSSTVRDVALSKTCRILYLVSKHALGFPAEIVPTLRRLLNADITSDARIDAACAVASLMVHSQMKWQKIMSGELAKALPATVSTLSIASGCVPNEQRPEISRAMLQVAQASRMALINMSKRRDAIVNIAALMNRANTRIDALRMAALLLRCETSATNLRSSNPCTGIILLRGLASVAQTAGVHVASQELAVAILVTVVDSDDWKLHQINIVLDALTGIAYSGSSHLLRTEVAFSLCRQLSKRNGRVDDEARRLFPTVIDFLQFDIDSIRLEALHTLEVCTRNQHGAEALTTEYAFVDSVSAIILSAVDFEQTKALSIVFNCSRHATCTSTMCQSQKLLTAIVDHATNQEVNTGTMWFQSLEIILNIMKEPANHVLLKECTELLPWLATAANVTESEVLKKKLVKAIIQLSHVYLQGGLPNRILV